MENNKWLKLSTNTTGPRYITDCNDNPVNLFGMARCQIHTNDEMSYIGNMTAICKHYKELGCNSVRLSISKFRIEEQQRDFIMECGGYNDEGLKKFIQTYVDPDVQAIIKEGMYIALDLHEYPPNDCHDDPNPQAIVDYAREHYFPIWKAIAKFYKDEPMIAMYELWNEPYPADQGTLSMGDDGHIRGGKYHNFDWNYHIRKFFVDLVDEVRKIDTRHMIMVSDYNAGWGCGWAMTWLGHANEVDSVYKNTLFSMHAASEHLGPRIDFFDDWWASICEKFNVCIQFGEIETEGELMTDEGIINLCDMFLKREQTHHYSGFLWRIHTDEENYVELWREFAKKYCTDI